jgi:hypothetical protein
VGELDEGGISIKNRAFFLLTLFSLFIPCLLFGVLYLIVHFGFNLGFEPIEVPPLHDQWALISIIYLLITAVLLFGLFIGLIAIRCDPIAASFFIGIGRVITLRAMQDIFTNMVAHGGFDFFTYTIYVYNDYYFFFLLLSLAPVGLYSAVTLVPKHTPGTGLSSRYLIGLILTGVGGYLLWVVAEKFSVFYFWGYPTLIFGLQGSLYVSIIGIGLVVLGFWSTRIRNR